ncbi:autotransporter outer membrane beta-barrel domain-containing protein [Edwardsiella anguillarum]|nr:autotransporter outer membrane beta-barrel domain-containing protein [Edwardsiella anguillarum]
MDISTILGGQLRSQCRFEPCLCDSVRSVLVCQRRSTLAWSAGYRGIVYQPTLMGGVKHAIGGADINTTMTFNGQRFSATLPRDRTRGVVDVGISSALNARFDMGINYRGEYGNNMTDHIGYVNGTLRF